LVISRSKSLTIIFHPPGKYLDFVRGYVSATVEKKERKTQKTEKKKRGQCGVEVFVCVGG